MTESLPNGSPLAFPKVELKKINIIGGAIAGFGVLLMLVGGLAVIGAFFGVGFLVTWIGLGFFCPFKSWVARIGGSFIVSCVLLIGAALPFKSDDTNESAVISPTNTVNIQPTAQTQQEPQPQPTIEV